MSEPNDLSCTVYVNTDVNVDDLAKVLSSELSASVSGPGFTKTIYTARWEVEVRRNPEWDAARATEFPDGFLFFRYRLEFYPGTDASREEQIAALSRILTVIWSQGISAVAACDEEDELPRKGGYKDRSIPWPSGDRLSSGGADMDSLPQPGAVQP